MNTTKKVMAVISSLLIFFVSVAAFPIYADNDEKKIVYVDTSDNFPPMEIIDGDDISGFNIEIINKLFEGTDYKPVFFSGLKLEENSYTPTIQLVTDEIPVTEGTVRSDTLYYQNYSAYTYGNDFTVKGFSKADLENVSVGVLGFGICYSDMRKRGIEPKVYDSVETALTDLKNGRINVWISNTNTTQYCAVKLGMMQYLHVNEGYEIQKEIKICVPYSEAELYKTINRRIEDIKNNGSYETIFMRYFYRHSLDYERRQKIEYGLKIGTMVAVLCIITAVFLIWQMKEFFNASRYNKAVSKSFLNYGNRFIILWSDDFSKIDFNRLFRNTFTVAKNEEEISVLQNCIDFNDLKKFLSSTRSENADEDQLCSRWKDIDGNIREIVWNSIDVDDRKKDRMILSIGSDMTEKYKLSRELEHSEERYEIAMESTDIAMIFIDSSGKITYLSDVGLRLLGMQPKIIKKEFVVEDILERLHPSDRANFSDVIVQSISNGGQSSVQVRVLCGNGRFRWFSFKFKHIIHPKKGEQFIAGVFFDIHDETEKDMKIEKLAFTDDLTGIYNRKKFLSILKETIAKAKLSDIRYAVVTFNLDKFHRFNDLYGVDVGDSILKSVANIIKYNPYGREFNCARLGNDEFAILARLDNTEEHLAEYVQEICARIQNFAADEYDEMKLTISAGGCIYPDNVSDYHDVYERAILSMRIAKNDPAIVYQPYDSSIKEMILQREIIERELQEAIEANQFELYYQPKVDVASESIIGAEALIRWNHPTRGIISPVVFIPIAEEIGIIGEIGKWTLKTACTQNKKWQNEGRDPIKISVNISSIEFYQSDIVGIVKENLESSGLDPQWLEIELTESMAVVDMEETVYKMNALRALGVGISMDDFGTGYSSLSYMQNLPIDELKLDKSFINQIAVDNTSKNIISTIIRLAKIIGLVVVAEGVEDREQFNLLKGMDCNVIQGFLFAKPLRTNEIEKVMEQKVFK